MTWGCAGLSGGCAGMTFARWGDCGCRHPPLSLRSRAPFVARKGRMTAPLGSRLRGNDGRVRGDDGRVRGFVELFHPHPRFKPGAGSNPLPSRERGCCTRHCPSGLPPTYGCHLKTGRLAAVASSGRVFGSVCAARTICSFDDQEGHAGSSFCPTRLISRCAIGR